MSNAIATLSRSSQTGSRSTPHLLRRFGRSGTILLAATSLLLIAPSAGGGDRPEALVFDSPGVVPLLAVSYRTGPGAEIVIRDHSLSPRLVQIESGDMVAWVSRSKTPSEIVFEREVAARMTCHGVVNFSIEGDELRSAPIHSGEVASFCELRPGRYRYSVVRTDPMLATAGGSRTRLEGLIVVATP